MKLKESVKGGKEVRGHAGPSPAKPLTCGQDPTFAAIACKDDSRLRRWPGSPGRPRSHRAALGAAHEGLSTLQPTHGHRGLDDSQARWHGKDRKKFDAEEGKWEVSRNSSFQETLINLSLFKPYGANAISRLLRTAQPRLLRQQTSFTLGSLLLSHRLCSIQRTAWLKRQER